MVKTREHKFKKKETENMLLIQELYLKNKVEQLYTGALQLSGTALV